MKKLLIILMLLVITVTWADTTAGLMTALNATKAALKQALEDKGADTTTVAFADYYTLVDTLVIPDVASSTITGEAQEPIVAGDIVVADVDNKISKATMPFDGLFPGTYYYFGYANNNGDTLDTVSMTAILWR